MSENISAAAALIIFHLLLACKTNLRVVNLTKILGDFQMQM